MERCSLCGKLLLNKTRPNKSKLCNACFNIISNKEYNKIEKIVDKRIDKIENFYREILRKLNGNNEYVIKLIKLLEQNGKNL